MGRVRVYLATSLDGFVAGPDNDLSWLDAPDADAKASREAPTDALTYADFTADVGAMLMGRTTYDVVQGFGEWPYGDMPVFVATHRVVHNPPGTVTVVQGDIERLVQHALQAADGRDVYVDGGALVRQALAAELVDELILTVVPVLLGDGVRLFDDPAVSGRYRFLPPTVYGDMVQLRALRIDVFKA